MSFDVRQMTVASEEHPLINEDVMLNLPRAFGVFDGMSGRAGGDRASRLAGKNVSDALRNLKEGLSLPQIKSAIEQALMEANKLLCDQGRKEQNKMGTTASVVYIWEGEKGERKAIVGNIGDSRVYLFRTGRLEQLTLDDSDIRKVPDEQQARCLQTKLSNAVNENSLTVEERELFKSRHLITQRLGLASVQPRIHVVDLALNDRILICSDGISDNLTDNEIKDILSTRRNSSWAVEQLIGRSRKRSREKHFRAKTDDMTAMLIAVSETNIPQKVEVKSQKPKTEDGQRLQKGTDVYVQRSNGMIESGWKIYGFDSETGAAIVVKETENGHRLSKEVPLNELEKLNHPAVLGDISSAKSKEELFHTLRRLGSVQGSKDYFNAEDLIEIINQVMNGETRDSMVTRTGRLREKVIELAARQRKT